MMSFSKLRLSLLQELPLPRIIEKGTQELLDQVPSAQLRHGSLVAEEILNSGNPVNTYLKKIEGVPGLNLTNTTVHTADIPEGYVFKAPVVNNTTIQGPVSPSLYDRGVSFTLDGPVHTQADATLTLKKVGTPANSWNDNPPTEISINGGELNQLNVIGGQGQISVHNLNASNVKVQGTEGLRITSDTFSGGADNPPTIKHLDIMDSKLMIQARQGKPSQPTVEKAFITGAGNTELRATGEWSGTPAIGDLNISNGARGVIFADGERGADNLLNSAIRSVQVEGEGTSAVLRGSFNHVNADNARWLNLDSDSLGSLNSTGTDILLSASGGSRVGRVSISGNNKTTHLYLSGSSKNPVKVESLIVDNGKLSGRLDQVTAGSINTRDIPIEFRDVELLGSDPLNISNTTSPSLLLRAANPNGSGYVRLRDNKFGRVELGGQGLGATVVGNSSLIKLNGLKDSNVYLNTNGGSLKITDDRGRNDIVLGDGKFGQINVSDSNASLPSVLWNSGDKPQGVLNLTGSSFKVNGEFTDLHAQDSTLIPGSRISAENVTLQNVKSPEGLRIADPYTGFMQNQYGNLNRDYLPAQIITREAAIENTHGLQGLEIAGKGHQVDIKDSNIRGAQLTGGAGRNVTLDHSQFTGARVVRTKAEIGTPVTYPHLEEQDKGSSIKGLREEGGGWLSTIRNGWYGVQDFFGMGGRR
jgi:hypothetical protein